MEANAAPDAGAHTPSKTTNSGGASASQAKTRTPGKAQAAPAPADDCSTPFWYDSSGVKRYKEHCLKK
jgi:hypothetical protein